jgi:hypothetical protein
MSYSDKESLVCRWCAGIIDPAYALGKYGYCLTCNRMFDNSFISAFELIEGQHFDRAPDGDIAFWNGFATLAAAVLWMTACRRVQEAGDWERTSLADLARLTRHLLEAALGSTDLPAPFVEPEAGGLTPAAR